MRLMGYCRGMRLATRASTLVFVAAAAVLGAWWFRSSAEAWHPIPRANLLVVTVDTLRADRLTDGVMPQLAAFARRSHVFQTAYAHAPLTLPSHASLFTGLLPPAHGVRGNGGFRLADAQVTLAERLKLAGYQTGAFVGAFVLDPRFGLAQGFDTYRAVDDGRAFAADFAFSERRADAVLRDADAWLQPAIAAGQPWHAWIHLFDPHAPYDAPGGPAGSYDDEVRYVDTQLGPFLARLQASGALERTVVVVTADHGESLGAHGESTHGLFVYDATVRVPLVIAGPGIGAATVTGPVGHIDLVPTVLDTLGLPADPALPGRSLRAGDRGGRPVYVEAMEGWLSAGAAPARGIVDGGTKFISVPETELYDLAADPNELRNIHATGDPRARLLAAVLTRLGESGDFSPAPSRDPAADARLRSLGYAAGAARPPNRAFGVPTIPNACVPCMNVSWRSSGVAPPIPMAHWRSCANGRPSKPQGWRLPRGSWRRGGAPMPCVSWKRPRLHLEPVPRWSNDSARRGSPPGIRGGPPRSSCR